MTRRPRTFSIQTLGCRVNHYESEQMAGVLRARGMRQVGVREVADVRVVHTCSVTSEAAAKSRQSVRRATRRLPVLQTAGGGGTCASVEDVVSLGGVGTTVAGGAMRRPRVVVTGCWATSDGPVATAIPGVDAVLGHDADVAGELGRLLAEWFVADEEDELQTAATDRSAGVDCETSRQPSSGGNNGWNDLAGASPDGADATGSNEALTELWVKGKTRKILGRGMTSLPALGERQGGHQRAFLKIQDGCDAHCTYCIIPRLRPTLWSKPVREAVEEARRLVEAGHRELVLTGIFIGAYGEGTALRRRREGARGEGRGAREEGGTGALGELLRALCEGVEGLARLRVSSMEPGDLTEELVGVMRGLPQVVPHFHLPLQSGSDVMLRRMNRQYSRGDYLRMIDRVRGAFDRPAITTDIIVGFPGEGEREFAETVEVVREAGFIHVHAFGYSPRPNTAAARWREDFVPAEVAKERVRVLGEMAREQSYAYRRGFVGETVEILVEHPSVGDEDGVAGAGWRHGRCERYFSVFVPAGDLTAGVAVRVCIDEVTAEGTWGRVVAGDQAHFSFRPPAAQSLR